MAGGLSVLQYDVSLLSIFVFACFACLILLKNGQVSWAEGISSKDNDLFLLVLFWARALPAAARLQ